MADISPRRQRRLPRDEEKQQSFSNSISPPKRRQNPTKPTHTRVPSITDYNQKPLPQTFRNYESPSPQRARRSNEPLDEVSENEASFPVFRKGLIVSRPIFDFDRNPSFRSELQSSTNDQFLIALLSCLYSLPAVSSFINRRRESRGELSQKVKSFFDMKAKQNRIEVFKDIERALEISNSDSQESILSKLLSSLSNEDAATDLMSRFIVVETLSTKHTEKCDCVDAPGTETANMFITVTTDASTTQQNSVDRKYQSELAVLQCPDCHRRRTKKWAILSIGSTLIIKFEPPIGSESNHAELISISLKIENGERVKFRFRSALRIGSSGFSAVFIRFARLLCSDCMQEHECARNELQNIAYVFYTRVETSKFPLEIQISGENWSSDYAFLYSLICLLVSRTFVSKVIGLESREIANVISQFFVNRSANNSGKLNQEKQSTEIPTYTLFSKVWELINLKGSDRTDPFCYVDRIFRSLQSDEFNTVNMQRKPQMAKPAYIFNPAPILQLSVPSCYEENSDGVWLAKNLFYPWKDLSDIQKRALDHKRNKKKADPMTDLDKCLMHKLGITMKIDGSYEQLTITHLGQLLIIKITENHDQKPSFSLKMQETTILDQFLETDFQYRLLGVLANGSKGIIAYVCFLCRWFRLYKGEVSSVDLPNTVQSVHYLVYEGRDQKLLTRSDRVISKQLPDRLKAEFANRVGISKFAHMLRMKFRKERSLAAILTLSQKQQESYGLRSGLPNLSNTCNVNVILNCLVSYPPFRSMCEHIRTRESIELHTEMATFCKHYEENASESVMRKAIGDLLLCLNVNPNETGNPAMFMEILLERLSRTPMSPFTGLNSMFRLETQSRYVYNNGRMVYNQRCQRWDYDVNLRPDSPESLDKLISASLLLHGGRDNGDSYIIETRFLSLSSVLVIHINRCFENRFLEKPVISPRILDCNQYLLMSGWYRRFAVVIQTIDPAHAVTIVNTNSGLYQFDDMKVEKMKEMDGNTDNVTMIFYVKIENSAKYTSLHTDNIDWNCLCAVLNLAFFLPIFKAFLLNLKIDILRPGNIAYLLAQFCDKYQREDVNGLLMKISESEISSHHPCPEALFSSILSVLHDVLKNLEKTEIELRDFGWRINNHRKICCAQLCDLFFLYTISALVCQHCFSPINPDQNIQSDKYIRTLEVEIPRTMSEGDNFIRFSNTEAYSRSVNSEFRYSLPKNYADAMKAFFQNSQMHPATYIEVISTDLQTCLKFTFRMSKFTKDTPCSKPSCCSHEFTSQTFVLYTGSTLVLKLKRFDADFVKINSTAVEFPYVLDMREYYSGLRQYSLRAFLCHEGASLRTAAFRTFIHVNDDWLEFANGAVTPATLTDDIFQSVYLLIYEKSDK